MKFLRERKEIARKINIERVPVLTIDIDHPMRGYDNCYEGSKINIAGAYTGDRYSHLLCRCTVEMFRDEPGNDCYETPWLYKTIILSPESCMLHSDFSLSDVEEMVEWSNARVAKAGDEVIVFFISKEKHFGVLRVMKIGERINPHCSTATTLKDIDE